MKKLFYIIPVLALLSFVSCSDEDDIDTTKPAISIISPADEDGFEPGDEISFSCMFSDDTELASYKIEIHSNFDGHDHEHTAVMKQAFEEEGHEWSYSKTYTFETGQTVVNVEDLKIQIPATITHEGVEEEVAEGDYHFGVHVADVAGNETSVFVAIEIGHHHL
ncbi:DUF4625 domain-containing protein [Plebeiibacterium marinum]|uniref:DUF4625 domain-containing protein n=1 Tax=Plebeiibacterium marinum TaxID=2992111 RepID=A0AAE3MF65_9BACT|nr:DUF4625 domain-containing protein [Plebeiobacterium marinum]MCW3806311.1 DUF4625 domain-containing protein [Plebeiobacterium marinum]